MPIQPFNNRTAVAFMDVSGFKQMMRNREKAMRMLSRFYQTGYETLREHRRERGMSVEGLFVTDCGILFVRNEGARDAEIAETLLSTVEDLNRRLFSHGIKTTTSIAFGLFRYSPLTEYEGLEKNFIFGDAYIDAYQDSVTSPKLDPGMCRLVLKDTNFWPEANGTGRHPIWSRCRQTSNHLYFYWMCNESGRIETVQRQYDQANQSRFQIIDGMLRDASRTWERRQNQT